MSWILYFIYLLLLIWIIQKWSFFNVQGISRRLLTITFLAKIVGGFAIFCIYNYYYSPRSACDIFNYFDDGLIVHSALFENPAHYFKMVTGIGSNSPELMQYYDACNFWIKNFNYGLPNDNHIVIRLNAIFCLVSMGNFHIHNMLFAFLSFIGLWAIYKSFAKQLSRKRVLLLIAIFYFPTVWFWTSGATKESVLIFAFGLFIYNYRKLLDKPELGNISGTLLCAFLFMFSKFYVLMAALPGLIALFWIRRSPKFALPKFVLTHFIIFVVAYLSKFITQVDLFQVICNKQHDFIMMAKSMTVGSYIDLPVLSNGLKDIATNAPSALLRTLLRPSVIEPGSATMMVAAIENLLIMCVLILCTIFIKIRNFSIHEVWFCLSFIAILFILTGLTTPVLGALVRYKMPALPFIGIAVLLLASDERLQPIEKWVGKKLN